jgi:hypothetical protein
LIGHSTSAALSVHSKISEGLKDGCTLFRGTFFRPSFAVPVYRRTDRHTLELLAMRDPAGLWLKAVMRLNPLLNLLIGGNLAGHMCPFEERKSGFCDRQIPRWWRDWVLREAAITRLPQPTAASCQLALPSSPGLTAGRLAASLSP